jgi:hypothetical protein
MTTLPDGTIAGKNNSVLLVRDSQQEQKLKDVVNELTNLFKVFTCTIPSEKFSNFLLNSMAEYQQNSQRSTLGSAADLRECLIKSSKRLVEYARQELEFSAEWKDTGLNVGIEDDVMKIIDKYF